LLYKQSPVSTLAGLFYLYNRIFTDKVLGIPLTNKIQGQAIFGLPKNIIHIFIYNLVNSKR